MHFFVKDLSNEKKLAKFCEHFITYFANLWRNFAFLRENEFFERNDAEFIEKKIRIFPLKECVKMRNLHEAIFPFRLKPSSRFKDNLLKNNW